MSNRSSISGKSRFGRRGFLGIAGALATTAYFPAFAQQYPTKSVRIVIPYPPGGPTDIVGRIVAEALAEQFHQPFVVENKAGASGMIGADVVAKAPADGSVLLVNVSGHVVNPSLYAQMPHDPIEDFKGITRLATTPIQLVVAADSPFRSVKDIAEVLKETPEKLTFASSSNGTPGHLMGELFNEIVQRRASHIPYKGSAPALTDLMGGHVSYMFDSMPSSIGLVKAGRLRALGVSSSSRMPALPDVPTFAEQGFPGLNLSTWYGFWAPARTPDSIVQVIYATTHKILQRPEIRQRLQDAQTVPGGEEPQQFEEFCKAEAQRYAMIIRNAGIKAE